MMIAKNYLPLRFFLSSLFFFFFTELNGQTTYQKVIQNENFDHNHYSIENVGNEQIIGGTIFNKGSLIGIKFHFAKINNSGSIVWEKSFDLGLIDGRCLDIEIGPNNTIYATGFIEDNSNREIFIMHLSSSGTMLSNKILNISGSYDEGIGLNLHYSSTKDELYLAGYESDDVTSVTSHKNAIVVALDPSSFSQIWSKQLNSTIQDHQYDMANAITEIPGEGIVITGSVTYNDGDIKQGVLCTMLDYDNNGSILWNISHQSLETSPEKLNHSGVTSLYDDISDKLYVLSNNTAWHTFQLTEISNVISSTPNISNTFSNTLYSATASNAIALDMVWSNGVSPQLVIAGFLQTDNSDPISYNSPYFIVKMDKNTGSLIFGKKLNSTNTGFIQHDEDYLQAYLEQQPFIHTPDIISKFSGGYTSLASNSEVGNFKVEILQVDNNGNIGTLCQDNFSFCPNIPSAPPTSSLISITDQSVTLSAYLLSLVTYSAIHKTFPSCSGKGMPCLSGVVDFNVFYMGCEVMFDPIPADANFNYNWDFGDGTSSNQMNPVHTFPPLDCFYTVCLTIESYNCDTILCKTIQMTQEPGCYNCFFRLKNDITEQASNEIISKIYPIPANQELNIEFENNFSEKNILIVLDDVTGRQMLRKNYNGEKVINLNISEFAKGLYILKIKNSEKIFNVSRVLKY